MEKTLTNRLHSLEHEIQLHPSFSVLAKRVSQARDILRKHQQVKIRGAFIRARNHWLKFRDKGSKVFFNLLKQKQNREKIDRIIIEDKELLNINEIKDAFEMFYKTLFTSEDNEASKDARNRCNNIIPIRISENEALPLKTKISMIEIVDAIKALKDDKAPGPDGLPIEFYKTNIEWVTKDLYDIYTEAFDNDTLGESINMGIVKLIPKDGDKALIKKWRPITLLNVSYKILAKALASRLEKILPKFICSTQIVFIKGRYILENLVTSWESMEWAKTSNQDTTMFLVDFEKAYDRVEWDFILMMLRAFRFPSEFCKYVQILLKDASALVEVNGSLSQPIPLSRSIRQGCPLAPALFVIASDALFYLLRDDTLSPKIHGIKMSDDSELLNIQFVDDTALFLELSRHNIDSLNQKLATFGRASGAHISNSKSILLGWKEEPPDWLQ